MPPALARLVIQELVDRAGGPLSNLLADLPRTVTTPEIRVDCPDEKKFIIAEKATEYFRQRYNVIDLDGVGHACLGAGGEGFPFPNQKCGSIGKSGELTSVAQGIVISMR